MSREQLKPKDKVVMRMTREGAVEENLTEGTSEKISNRLEDAQLVKPHEADPSVLPEEAAKHKQPLPEDLLPKQDEQPPDEAPTEQVVSEYKPGELPVIESHSPSPSIVEAHHAASADPGIVMVKTTMTSSARRTQAVEAVDGEAILGKAADTAAEKPVIDEAAPTTKKIQRLEKKSEKAHERLDAAREKLPTKKVLKKERVFDDEKGKGKTRLYFEDEIKMPKGQSKLQFEADKSVRKVGDTLASGIHGKIHEVEQDNSAVEAAHRTEIVAETAARHYSHHKKSQANKPFEKVSKLEHEAQVADTKLHYEKTQQEHPEMKKQRTNMNKHYQKQSIKKDYAAARKAGSQTASTATKNTGKKVGEKAADKVKEFVSKNKKVFIWIGVGLLILVLLAAGISSCTAMFSSTGTSIITSSYLSEDEAMLGAEVYAPFGAGGVNGGKLRQCVMLIETAQQRDPGIAGVATYCSIHSPQGPITAAAARHFGLPCLVAYGGASKASIATGRMPRLSMSYGATVEVVAASVKPSSPSSSRIVRLAISSSSLVALEKLRYLQLYIMGGQAERI